MKTFSYEIKDEIGIHARPAGLLVKEAKKYESKIIVKKEGKSAEATKLMAVMGLGVKCGQTVEVEITGQDEEAAYEGIKEFFEKNL
ncbi:HPr family phosphocarrier protein [Lachnospiraceae bacterium 62-35]